MCPATSNSKTQLLTLAAFGITATGEATGIVDLGDSLSTIQVIGTQAIRDGSSVMVARLGASLTAFNVNHGAGRRLSRTEAKSLLTRSEVNASLENADILSNSRDYPIDESPDADKDIQEVLNSVEKPA